MLTSSAGDSEIDSGDFDLARFTAADRLVASEPLPARLTALPTARAGIRVCEFTLNG
ncbi:hypothetical protein [Streptomyces scopuliridis]|uniref:hypothetical protein n=1 Tax=Streptomyces scopuliridis TaxID=452529 RepID=UPI0036A6DCF8